MPLWIPISLAAAAMQTLRFLLQRRLKGLGLSAAGATFSRFLFGAPLAWLLVLSMLPAIPVPHTDAIFWLICFTSGVAQIIGTWCTVTLFGMRNFAVGVAFTKTETVQVAIFSALFLGEAVSAGGFLAILVGMAGVLLLSWPAGARIGASVIWNRTMALGLVAGAAFALSAIGYRAAGLRLGADHYFFRAAFTLACVTTLQSFTMLGGLRLLEPGEISRVLTSWKSTALVGLTGMLGSLGWFTAFVLQNAAYVRAFGQVELIFSITAGWLFLGERMTTRELVGVALLGLSLVAIVLAA